MVAQLQQFCSACVLICQAGFQLISLVNRKKPSLRTKMFIDVFVVVAFCFALMKKMHQNDH